jgi:hypothetical protein
MDAFEFGTKTRAFIETREILPVLRQALSSGYNRGILSEGEQISLGNRNHCDTGRQNSNFIVV